MPPSPIKPKTLTLRAYQVGFGDCFLLTFHYPARSGALPFARHVLIDCGSSSPPKNAPAGHMERVAQDIAAECGGKLHAVVVTHRHSDHLSGFARRSDGKGSGNILRALNPDLVLQPWTEDPQAPPDATAPVQDPGRAFKAALAGMPGIAGAVVAEARTLQGLLGERRLALLDFLGGQNLSNDDAVRNLMDMGARHVYASHGSRSGLEEILPGVKIHVLGPPTLDQSSAIRRQRASNDAEFWKLQASASSHLGPAGPPLFPHAPVHPKDQEWPSWARWLIPRMLSLRGEQLLEIVRALDEQMNNTSLILLFQTARRKLLFPGDAQFENWSYALNESPAARQIKTLLAGVDFYKVGHHGSGNATPKTLWNLFARKAASDPAGRLQTLLSTKPGKHPGVPAETLVSTLESESLCHNTETIKPSALKLVLGPIDL